MYRLFHGAFIWPGVSIKINTGVYTSSRGVRLWSASPTDSTCSLSDLAPASHPEWAACMRLNCSPVQDLLIIQQLLQWPADLTQILYWLFITRHNVMGYWALQNFTIFGLFLTQLSYQKTWNTMYSFEYLMIYFWFFLKFDSFIQNQIQFKNKNKNWGKKNRFGLTEILTKILINLIII